MYHPGQVDCSLDWENHYREPVSRLDRPSTGILPAPSLSRKTAVTENLIDVLIYIYENYMDSEESVPVDQILSLIHI